MNDKTTDLICNVAVLGRVQLMPGILPVELKEPDVKCLVAHAFPKNMTDPERGIDIDVADCTVFTVTHIGQGDIDIGVTKEIQKIFERSISAISEVTIWTKTQDIVGKMSSFTRQIGTVDVKAFFAQGTDERLVGWLNPAFTFNRDAAAMMSGFLSSMIVSNGPAANPVPPITRRVMSSIDLISLGFYTESFVNLFSLSDDLTQEVIKSGLAQKGLSEEDQKGMLRAIKEERLKIYLCNLAKLCGWKSLEEENKNFYKKVVKVNTIRNKIMHGSRRLSLEEAIDSSNVLLDLIDWLRQNPFGYQIEGFPLLKVASPNFSIVPIKTKENEDGEKEAPQDDSNT